MTPAILDLLGVFLQQLVDLLYRHGIQVCLCDATQKFFEGTSEHIWQSISHTAETTKWQCATENLALANAEQGTRATLPLNQERPLKSHEYPTYLQFQFPSLEVPSCA